MTTHELANILLKQEDVPVVYRFLDHDHNDDWYYADIPVNEVHFFEDTVYLVKGDFVSPEEEERRQEEERLYWEEEYRKEKEAEAKKLTWGKLLSHTSKETQEAFISFYNNKWDQDRYLSLEINSDRITYLLSLHFASNARLSKEHMSDLVTAAGILGLTINPELIDLFDRYISMTRYNTEKEQLAALKAARNNNK